MVKVSDFYQKLFNLGLDGELNRKMENVHDEKEYRDFIRDEILPLAKSMGYDFSVDEIVAYDESVLQSLSEDELEAVAGGGALKNISSSFAAALTLLTNGGIASATKDGEQLGRPQNVASESARPSPAGDSSEFPPRGTVSRATAEWERKIDAARDTMNSSSSTQVGRLNDALISKFGPKAKAAKVVKSKAQPKVAKKTAEQVNNTSVQPKVKAKAAKTATQSLTPEQVNLVLLLAKGRIAELAKIIERDDSQEKLAFLRTMLINLDIFYGAVGKIANCYSNVDPVDIPEEVKVFFKSFKPDKTLRGIETHCVAETTTLRKHINQLRLAANNYGRSQMGKSLPVVNKEKIQDEINECVSHLNRCWSEVFAQGLQNRIPDVQIKDKDMDQFVEIFRDVRDSNIVLLKDAVSRYCTFLDTAFNGQVQNFEQFSKSISPTNLQIAPVVQKMNGYVKCWRDLNTQLSSAENTADALKLSAWIGLNRWVSIANGNAQEAIAGNVKDSLIGLSQCMGAGLEALSCVQPVTRVELLFRGILDDIEGYLQELKADSQGGLSVPVSDGGVEDLRKFIESVDNKVLTTEQKKDLLAKCKTSESICTLLRRIQELKKFVHVDGLVQDVSTIAVDLSKPMDLSQKEASIAAVENFQKKVTEFHERSQQLALDFQQLQDDGNSIKLLNQVQVWLDLYAKE